MVLDHLRHAPPLEVTVKDDDVQVGPLGVIPRGDEPVSHSSEQVAREPHAGGNGWLQKRRATEILGDSAPSVSHAETSVSHVENQAGAVQTESVADLLRELGASTRGSELLPPPLNSNTPRMMKRIAFGVICDKEDLRSNSPRGNQ